MNWNFLLITSIMICSSYVTSSFSSLTDRLREVVGGLVFSFNVILLSDFYMTLILLWGFNFSFLWKGVGFFRYLSPSIRNKEPFLWSVLSAYPTSLSTSVHYMSLPLCVWVFCPPWVLYSVSNSVCFEAFLFTQFSQVFLSLAVILVSSLFWNQGL